MEPSAARQSSGVGIQDVILFDAANGQRRETTVSSTYDPSISQERGVEIVGALLFLLGASALSAVGISAFVVYLYEAVWGATILLVVRYRWRAHVPLRAPLYRIVVTATILIVALWSMALLPVSSESGIDITSVSPVWLFGAALLAVPAAIGNELFFRGVIYDLAQRRVGVGAAVVVSGLLPVSMQLPFDASLQGVGLAATSGLLLAASRAVTGSLAPALVAQCLQSLAGVAFILLLA